MLNTRPRFLAPGPYHRNGLVLLMVLGVLALMSVLAVSFVSMARLERSVSRNYVERIRARLAAESGVEKVISLIQSRSGAWTSDDLDWMAYGSDLTRDLPLDLTQDPSFKVEANGNPALEDVSGIVDDSNPEELLLYKLKVEDESGKFNLNDSPGPAPLRMFNIVSRLAGLVTDDEGLGLLIADNIFSDREALGGRFSTLAQVREAILDPQDPALSGVAISDEQWSALSRNLTLYSWTDPNTLAPNPPDFSDNGNINIILTSSGFNRRPAEDEFSYDVAPGAAFPEYLYKYRDEVYTVGQAQARSLSLEPRSPVHLNAASRELIEALLDGIQGYYIYEYGHQYLRGGVGGIPASGLKNLNIKTFSGEQWCGGEHIPAMVLGTSPSAVAHIVEPAAKNYRPLVYDAFKQYVPANFAQESTYDLSSLAAGGLGVYKKSIKVSRALGTGPDDNLVVDLAEALHSRIHADGYDLNHDGDTDDPYEPRNPFRTWQEFKHFIYAYFQVDDPAVRVPRPEDEGDETLPPYLPNYAKRAVADAILANFNPNSDMIDYNPNRLLHKLVDKAHLVNSPATDAVGYSTEFCLEPTGTYSIECLGLLRNADNKTLAGSTMRACIEVFRPYRMTSQAQFLGKDSRAPLESANDLDRFLMPAKPGPLATSGVGAGMTGPDGATYGYTTEIYPEPFRIDGNDLETHSLVGGTVNGNVYDPGAVFDGYIMPATWQQNNGGAALGRSFRASFNSLKADFALSSPDYYHETQADVDLVVGAGKIVAEHSSADRLMIPKSLQDHHHATAGTSAPDVLPGNLYKDGAYSEPHRSLLYTAGECTLAGETGNGQPIITGSVGNFGDDFGSRGSLTMWVKPNWQPERAGRPHTFFDVSTENKWPYSLYAAVNIGRDGTSSAIPPFVINGNAPLFDRSFAAVSQETAPAMDQSVFRLMFHPGRNYASQPPTDPNNSSAFIATFETVAAFQGDPYSIQVRRLTKSTRRANHQQLSDEDIASTAGLFHHALGHRWNYIGIIWHNTNSGRMVYQINETPATGFTDAGPPGLYGGVVGIAQSGDYRVNLWRNHTPKIDVQKEIYEFQCTDLTTQAPVDGSYEMDNFRRPIDDPHTNLMRFGQWARGTANFTADATFDEINIYKNSLPAQNANWLKAQYEIGRFFNTMDETPAYISPDIEPHHVLGIPIHEDVVLRSLSCTLYWPNDVIDGLEASDVDNSDAHPNPIWENVPGAETWDPVSFDVWTEESDWLYSADGSERGNGNPETPFTCEYGSIIRDAAGKPIHVKRNQSVRYKAFFNQRATREISVQSGVHGVPPTIQTVAAPVHEAPVLDDVTLFFEFTTPRVITWTWGE